MKNATESRRPETMTTTYKRPATLFTRVNSKYGAPMGRCNITEMVTIDHEDAIRFRVEKIRWSDGGYDQGGAYWGAGLPVYLAVHENGDDYIRRSYRARSRQDAITQLRAEFPNAKTR